jgi:hypothetical protein
MYTWRGREINLPGVATHNASKQHPRCNHAAYLHRCMIARHMGKAILRFHRDPIDMIDPPAGHA